MTATDNDSVRFIHLSDTHLGPTKSYALHGAQSYARTAAVVQAINLIAAQEGSAVDFVIHTGDVATDGDSPDYSGNSTALAASVLKKLVSPLHVVNGNHDDLKHLQTHFPVSGSLLASVTGCSPREYSRAVYFRLKNRLFVILDARPIPIVREYEPRGRLLRKELDALTALLQRERLPTTIFMHYPPVELNCPWMDEMMLVQYPDGESLHSVLMSSGVRIDGLFFGHVHRNISVVRDGILYASAGAVTCHFDALPTASSAHESADPIAYFNYVTLGPRGTMIKQQWCFAS